MERNTVNRLTSIAPEGSTNNIQMQIKWLHDPCDIGTPKQRGIKWLNNPCRIWAPKGGGLTWLNHPCRISVPRQMALE